MMIEQDSLLFAQEKPNQLGQVHMDTDKATDVQMAIEHLYRPTLQRHLAIFSFAIATVDVEKTSQEGGLSLLHCFCLIDNFLNIIVIQALISQFSRVIGGLQFPLQPVWLSSFALLLHQHVFVDRVVVHFCGIQGHHVLRKQDDGAVKAAKVTKQSECIIGLSLLRLGYVGKVYVHANTRQL